MLYIKIISKNKREGCYVKFENDYVAKLVFRNCAIFKESITASRIELLTPTGKLLQSYDYE